MCLCRTVCEIAISVKNRKKITHPLLFCVLAEGVPFGIGYRHWGSKTRMELPGRERSLTISSAVWIQCTNVTDGQTDTGPQQRSRLRIASRGNRCIRRYKHHNSRTDSHRNKRMTIWHSTMFKVKGQGHEVVQHIRSNSAIIRSRVIISTCDAVLRAFFFFHSTAQL